MLLASFGFLDSPGFLVFLCFLVSPGFQGYLCIHGPLDFLGFSSFLSSFSSELLEVLVSSLLRSRQLDLCRNSLVLELPWHITFKIVMHLFLAFWNPSKPVYRDFQSLMNSQGSMISMDFFPLVS